MIEEIRIRGLGVIEEAVLDLHPGFTVVTGETGAGKTMVLTGLGLLLGAKADAGAVRRGADRAEVDGSWQVDPTGVPAARTAEAGGTVEEGALLVGRTLSAEGRSRAFLGGRAVPAAVLAQVVGDLVAVHGQSDQHRLSAPSRQRELLDRFGGDDVLGPRERYRTTFAEWRAVHAEHAALVAAGRERAREADQLRFGLAEVAAVQPQEGEDLALAAESERLSHAEALVAGAHTARTSLASDGEVGDVDVLALVAVARRALEAVRAHDPVLGVAADRLAEVAVSLADIAADLASYEASVEADPTRQEAVEQRRAQLGALTRKYGDTVAEVLAWSEQAAGRLAELEGTDERLGELASRQVSLRRELAEAAGVLHIARTAAAARLGTAVTAELVHLAMPHARVEVDVSLGAAGGDDTLEVEIDGRTCGAAPGPQGIDEVEIRLAPHPGAELRSLAKGASGGELSRVMLALEVALAGTDPVPTFVFDEVDAGIGGRAAVEVGRRLARLARGSQVVVVTHLPQVAAFADRHLVVHKADDGSVTRSGIGAVAGDDRVRELARMLAGLEESDTGAAHARELLDLAAADRAGAAEPAPSESAAGSRARSTAPRKAAR